MSSVRDRKKNRKARTVARAIQGGGVRQASAPGPVVARPKFQRRQDGLSWLRNKGKIDQVQEETGRRYGSLYRIASIENPISLKSSLDIDGAFGATSGGGLPKGTDNTTLIVRAREDLLAARLHLDMHSGMIAGLDLVCGKGWTPREALPVQREAEQLETALRIALDLLGAFWRTRAVTRA